MIRVIGVGLACLDYLLQVPDLEQVAGGCELQAFKLQGGGMAATAMAAVARLGGQAELWTVVGRDRHGDAILEELEAEGVDLSQVVRSPPGLESAFNFILVDGRTGERVFLLPKAAWRGSGVPLGDVPADLSRVDAVGALLVDGHWKDSLALPALRRAREAGVPTCGDIANVARDEDLLPLIDYLVVPRQAAERVAGEAGPRALEVLAGFGARVAAITLGSRGVLYLADGRVTELPAFEVEAVDTTGAGDVFHGALVYGVARGWGPRRLMLFSSAVAALKCTQLGGRTGIPTLAQVRRFLAERVAGEDLGWTGNISTTAQDVQG